MSEKVWKQKLYAHEDCGDFVAYSTTFGIRCHIPVGSRAQQRLEVRAGDEIELTLRKVKT